MYIHTYIHDRILYIYTRYKPIMPLKFAELTQKALAPWPLRRPGGDATHWRLQREAKKTGGFKERQMGTDVVPSENHRKTMENWWFNGILMIFIKKNHRKMGKPWENHGKTIGKPEKMMENGGLPWFTPLVI